MTFKKGNQNQRGIFRSRYNKPHVPKEKFSDPVYCKKFGCGKQLTPEEYLMSEYCFEHSKPEKKQELINDLDL